MKQIIFLVVVALAALAHAQMDQKSANQFVDQMIYALVHNKDTPMDPLKIGPFHKDIDEHLGAIHIKGKISGNNTEIDGLSRLHRLGDANLKSENGHVIAQLGLEDRNMKFLSDLHIDIGHIFHPNLDLEVDIGAIDMHLAIAVGGSGIELKDFVIDELDDVEIFVHGLSILDPIIDFLGDSYISLFNKNACEQITKIVRPILEDAIKNMTKSHVDGFYQQLVELYQF